MPEKDLPKISIVIPAYNEAEAIGIVLDDVRKAMEELKAPYEIIVVDDDSQDSTTEIAKAKGAKLVTHHRNQGSGAARRSGILAAKGDIVVMLDADGTYAASDISAILKPFPEADQVIGARKVEAGSYPLLRGPAKWLICKLACLLTRQEIPDLNSGLRAVKREIMLKFLHLLPEGFSCVSTMTLAFLMNGFNVVFVPCEYRSRIGNSKFHPIKDTYNYLITVVRMVMYFDPLRILMPISIVIGILGFLKGIFDFFYTGTLQESDIILMLFSINLAAIGVLGDLLARREKAKILKKDE